MWCGWSEGGGEGGGERGGGLWWSVGGLCGRGGDGATLVGCMVVMVGTVVWLSVVSCV